jgi:hypothetical protein
MKRNTFGAALIGAAALTASCTSMGTVATGSGAPQTSAPSSSAPQSSAAASSALAASAPASSGSSDQATTAWFSAFCGRLTPVLGAEKDVKTRETAVTKTDYAAQRKLLVDFLTSAGPQVTSAAAALQALPAPTFSGGGAFAAKVVEAFGKAGSGLTAAGQKLAAVDVSKGPSGLSSAAPHLAADLASIAAPITAVGDLDIPDATKGDLLALAACAKLQSTVAG